MVTAHHIFHHLLAVEQLIKADDLYMTLTEKKKQKRPRIHRSVKINHLSMQDTALRSVVQYQML